LEKLSKSFFEDLETWRLGHWKKNIDFLREQIRLTMAMPMKVEKHFGGQNRDTEAEIGFYFCSVLYLLLRKKRRNVGIAMQK